jgi:hypothetical protein
MKPSRPIYVGDLAYGVLEFTGAPLTYLLYPEKTVEVALMCAAIAFRQALGDPIPEATRTTWRVDT